MRRLVWPLRKLIFSFDDRIAVYLACENAKLDKGKEYLAYEQQATNLTRNFLFAEVVAAVKAYEKYWKLPINTFTIIKYVRNRVLTVKVVYPVK